MANDFGNLDALVDAIADRILGKLSGRPTRGPTGEPVPGRAAVLFDQPSVRVSEPDTNRIHACSFPVLSLRRAPRGSKRRAYRYESSVWARLANCRLNVLPSGRRTIHEQEKWQP